MTNERERWAKLTKLNEMITTNKKAKDDNSNVIEEREFELARLEMEAEVYRQADLEGMANNLTSRIESVKLEIKNLSKIDFKLETAIIKAAEQAKATLEAEIAEETSESDFNEEF